MMDFSSMTYGEKEGICKVLMEHYGLVQAGHDWNEIKKWAFIICTEVSYFPLQYLYLALYRKPCSTTLYYLMKWTTCHKNVLAFEMLQWFLWQQTNTVSFVKMNFANFLRP